MEILKNESLADKMTILSMCIDCTAAIHETKACELWKAMYNTALKVYDKCGEMEDKK